MAVLRKFKAIRPQKELAKNIASYPYDVLSTEEARELAKDNEYSFLHVVRSEVSLSEDIDSYSKEVYEKAKENLQNMINQKWLIQDEVPKLYLYRQIMNDLEQHGIVGCVSAEDYENGKIKKHELTRKAKENDRINHVYTTNINSGPVFLTYKNKDSINKIVEKIRINEPEYDFTADDGIRHTVWLIEDDNVNNEIVDEFSKIDSFYIADGHHRAASAAAVAKKRREENDNHTGTEEYNYFLAVLFADKELTILDYNRVVTDLNGLSEEDFFHKLGDIFRIEKKEKKYKPQKKGELGMYLEGDWYKLDFIKNIDDEINPAENLDTSKLQKFVLEPLLGIEDPRTDERIDFIGGIRGLSELEKLVNSNKFRVAFALYPTSVTELMDIADSGGIMPPKSTWFEPKLRSGLLIHDLE
ncbi:MAG: DUF1015 family protein [Spirochaetia bacterium]|nr:DUF1015 family protein [Spirochaetia bacterium]